MKSMDSVNKPDALNNCDNTSDADKPVSTAQQAALDATPIWKKLSVTFAQVQVDGVTKTVALIALPINAWVHALAWKAPADWAPAAGEWEAGTLELVLTLKDEDGVKVFLNEGVLGAISGGAWVPAALEGGAGQSPQRFSSSVTKNLVAIFEVRAPA